MHSTYISKYLDVNWILVTLIVQVMVMYGVWAKIFYRFFSEICLQIFVLLILLVTMFHSCKGGIGIFHPRTFTFIQSCMIECRKDIYYYSINCSYIYIFINYNGIPIYCIFFLFQTVTSQVLGML